MRSADVEADIDRNALTRRYYKFFYCELSDGRVFHAGPSRDVGFSHHLNANGPSRQCGQVP